MVGHVVLIVGVASYNDGNLIFPAVFQQDLVILGGPHPRASGGQGAAVDFHQFPVLSGSLGEGLVVYGVAPVVRVADDGDPGIFHGVQIGGCVVLAGGGREQGMWRLAMV